MQIMMSYWFPSGDRGDKYDNEPSSNDEGSCSSFKSALTSDENPHFQGDDDALSSQSHDGKVDSNGSSVHYDVNKRIAIKHALIMSLGTYWWYLYSAITILVKRPQTYTPTTIAMTAGASYVIISQLLAYFWTWNLMHAKTLRKAQLYVALTVSSCIPADCIIVLFDPTGNKLLTVLAFAVVTVFFCVPLAHHLRLASLREDYNKLQSVSGGVKNGDDDRDDGCIENVSNGHNMVHHNSMGLLTALGNYRPTNTYQSTHMALKITKAFVSLVVALSALFGALGLGPKVEEGGEGGTGGELSHNVLVYASLACVLGHTSMDVLVHFLFPGFEGDDFTLLNIGQAVLYAIHFIAAGLIGDEVGQNNHTRHNYPISTLKFSHILLSFSLYLSEQYDVFRICSVQPFGMTL